MQPKQSFFISYSKDDLPSSQIDLCPNQFTLSPLIWWLVAWWSVCSGAEDSLSILQYLAGRTSRMVVMLPPVANDGTTWEKSGYKFNPICLASLVYPNMNR